MGTLTGFLNGFFGSGGGLIAVPLLKKAGTEQKKAHATSIALTLPLSIISTIVYCSKGNIDFSLAMKYIPAGFVGAIIGGILLKKISNKTLKKIFGFMLIISGVWLFLKWTFWL